MCQIDTRSREHCSFSTGSLHLKCIQIATYITLVMQRSRLSPLLKDRKSYSMAWAERVEVNRLGTSAVFVQFLWQMLNMKIT